MAITWSTTDKSTYVTLSNGNLTASISNTSPWHLVRATKGVDLSVAGKYYWEIKIDGVNSGGSVIVGLYASDVALDLNDGSQRVAKSITWYNALGINKGTTQLVATSFTTGDVLGFAVDTSAKTLAMYKNGVLATTATDIGSVASVLYPAFIGYGPLQPSSVTANFGASIFAYAIPSGYLPLGVEPPVVTITAPSGGTLYTVGENINISLSAKDATYPPISVVTKLKKSDSSEVIYETASLQSDEVHSVGFAFSDDVLNGSVTITATNQIGLSSTKTISFGSKQAVAAVDVSNTMFKSGDVVKATALSGGSIAVQDISPALGSGVVSGVTVTPATVHAEPTTLAGTVGSTKGSVRYRVLCGGTEIKPFGAYGSSFNISELLQTLALPAGANVLTVEVENESGVKVTGTVTLTKNNNNPTITATLTQLSLVATFNDADNDDLQYRVLVDGVEKVPWTPKERGVQVTHDFSLADLDYFKVAVPFTSVVRVEVKDVAGGVASQEFTVAPIDKDAVITVTQENVSIPKDTPYNMAFTIDPPFYANPITGVEMAAASETSLGSGKTYTYNFDRFIKLQSLSITV